MADTGLNQLSGLQGLEVPTEMPVPHGRGLRPVVKRVGTVSIHLSVNVQ